MNVILNPIFSNMLYAGIEPKSKNKKNLCNIVAYSLTCTKENTCM
jgi:hypothetical protein